MSFRAVEADDGDLAVRLLLENRTERERSAEVIITATVGEDSFQQTRTITVPANSQTDAVVAFEVPYQEYVGNGSISARIA